MYKQPTQPPVKETAFAQTPTRRPNHQYPPSRISICSHVLCFVSPAGRQKDSLRASLRGPGQSNHPFSRKAAVVDTEHRSASSNLVISPSVPQLDSTLTRRQAEGDVGVYFIKTQSQTLLHAILAT